ncbi:MAG: hypothetical protein F4Y07_10270 [Gemmatimonadetes bacterium]|nr:hypothetical protein [Gemmatimonadota bacterium]MYE16850.1 hypothetical protein [Gemmatimonadota bacterium]
MNPSRLTTRWLRALWLPTLFAPVFAAAPLSGQSASVGADIVSRYVWRGTDFGESLSVQPALTFGLGGLEVGAWGSYSISASGADANENDLWATYTINASNGASIAFTVTDYYFPAPGAEEGFSYTNSHTLELAVGFTGPESFPISVYGGMMARNDPDNSVYLEASLPVSAFEGVDVGLVAGMVAGASGFYGTDGAAVVNLGVSASKALEITDSFAPPVSVSYIFNPDSDRAFLVFGLSVAP